MYDVHDVIVQWEKACNHDNPHTLRKATTISDQEDIDLYNEVRASGSEQEMIKTAMEELEKLPTEVRGSDIGTVLRWEKNLQTGIEVSKQRILRFLHIARRPPDLDPSDRLKAAESADKQSRWMYRNHDSLFESDRTRPSAEERVARDTRVTLEIMLNSPVR